MLKTFNRNTIEISYSCVRNIKQIVTNIPKVQRVKTKQQLQQEKTCPLDVKLLTSGMIILTKPPPQEKDDKQRRNIYKANR